MSDERYLATISRYDIVCLETMRGVAASLLHGFRYMVTFSYKERGRPEVKWTLPVEKFMGLLVQHIPPQHFKVVCYYGALASRTNPVFKGVLKKLFRRMEQMTKSAPWRERLISLTGKDPLRCPICQREMELVEVAYLSTKSDSLALYHPT